MSEILDRFSDIIIKANKEKKSIRFIGGDSKKFSRGIKKVIKESHDLNSNS